MKIWPLSLLVISLVPSAAAAQTDAVTTPPPNLVVPNYNTVPVGPFAGLESTAYVARVDDPSAAWFNPAGLGRKLTAQISGSAGVYANTSVAPQSLTNQGGSIQQLPNFVGFTLNVREGMTAGVALLTNNAWIQETDTERFMAVPTGQERFAYSADSEFTRRVAAVGVGYHRDGGWRLGGGFAFSLMTLRLVQSTSDRRADASGLQTLLVASRASGSALQLRAQGGAQYDRGPWRFGGAVRTPGLNLYRNGSIAFDAALDANAGSRGASLFDTNASLEYHLPWEFQAGAGRVGERVEVEVDLLAFTSIAAYPLISSGQPTLVYGATGTGVPPSVISQPFAGLTSASNGVVNVSAGGRVRVFKERNLRVHGGVASSQSPVGAADVVFSPVDLVSWTVGASGSAGKFQFTFGFNRQTGTTDEITLRNLIDASVIRTRADARVNGFVYQLAYQF